MDLLVQYRSTALQEPKRLVLAKKGQESRKNCFSLLMGVNSFSCGKKKVPIKLAIPCTPETMGDRCSEDPADRTDRYEDIGSSRR
jgi:hypothetical protein